MKVHLPYPKNQSKSFSHKGKTLEVMHVLKITEFPEYCNHRIFNPFYGPKPPRLYAFYGTPPTLDHNLNPKSATSIGFSWEEKKKWSRRVGLNHRPAVYETAALPLSYAGL